MDLEPEEAELKAVLNRLRRAQGQISGVIRMIEEGQDYAEVVTQLSAASRALDRAGFSIIATSLRKCVAETESGRASSEDGARMRARLERLFLSLA
ncbi:metal-sensitive transcriptional regulator [Streptomyces sp. NPDC001068]|uniref:metal-sensitive transcriptional regulator n=1 Tax=Streptomyces sp. NPDC001068 TaxID=3364544 RepID=UPI003696803D